MHCISAQLNSYFSYCSAGKNIPIKNIKKESTNPTLFDQDDKDGIILTAVKI